MLGYVQGAGVRMMMAPPAGQAGHTLIEMAVVIAIAGILLGYAAHSYREWIANSQIRTAAETLVEGLSAARNEAIRLNRPVGFHLISNLSNSCELTDKGSSWVVSIEDPSGKCDRDASEDDAPQIVAKRAGSERTSTVSIRAYAKDDCSSESSSVSFSGIGRVVTAGSPIVRIDVGSSVLGDQARNLRVIVSPGGMIRMCDPKADDSDPRSCPADKCSKPEEEKP